MKAAIKSFLKKLAPPLPPEPPTHYVKLNGVTAFVFLVRDEGQSITLCGWSQRPYQYEPGHYLILESRDGTTTRYVVDELDVPCDPGDQYFARCSFAPREIHRPDRRANLRPTSTTVTDSQ